MKYKSHPAFRKSKTISKSACRKANNYCKLVIVFHFPTTTPVFYGLCRKNVMSVEEIVEKFKVIRHRATQALPDRLDEESELEENAIKLWDDVKDVRDLAKEIMNLVQPEIFEILDWLRNQELFVSLFLCVFADCILVFCPLYSVSICSNAESMYVILHHNITNIFKREYVSCRIFSLTKAVSIFCVLHVWRCSNPSRCRYCNYIST